MRSFIITLILLIAMILAIVANALYINNTAEARRVRALIADCASDISRLERLSIENLL